jgi:microcystin-dependent protein
MMKTFLASSIAASALLAAAPAAQAQTQPMVGEISAFGFSFCPRGWTSASGQLLPISQYSALFSLYGTNFGGDGRTTFGVPDMRGRVAIHAGQAPGLSNYRVGQRGGSERVTLSVGQMASHGHSFNGSSAGPTTRSINGATFATYPAGTSAYADPGALNETMNSGMVRLTGNGQSFSIQQPLLAVTYCVSLTGGLYPSRNEVRRSLS